MTIQGPNYTQIPNVILDNLQELKGAEVKVIMAICRNTFGYHRTTNRFSLSYLQKITGLSRQGVVNSTKKLVEIDWLNRHSASLKGGQGWEYEINLEVVQKLDQSKKDTSQKNGLDVVKKVDHLVVKKFDPLNKEVKEKDKEKVLSPEGDESQKPKTQGKKKAKTTETFLKDCAPEYREKFENWWKWYKSRCDELNSQWGSKASAAKEWALMESSFDADEFRKGCRLWFKQAKSKNNYAPHGYIFLKGKDTHVEPYWVAALDFVKDSELGDGFMSEKIHEINGDGRPVLSQSQVEELRRIDSEGGYVSNEEAMYIIPGFKVDNPNWKNVRFAA